MSFSLSEKCFGRSAFAPSRRNVLPRCAAMLLLSLSAALLVGCKTPQSQILLERENFKQEQQIEDLQEQLEDCHRQLAALKHPAGGVIITQPSVGSPQIINSPVITTPQSSPEVPTFEPPTIEHGTTTPSESTPSLPKSSPATLPDSTTPPALPNASQNQWMPSRDPAVVEEPEDAEQDPGATLASYQSEPPADPDRIAIIRLLTNGHQFGGHGDASFAGTGGFADNGLQVTFSPRDGQNHAVASDGTVALVVVDPAISGPESHVARWDFNASELAAHYRQTLFGKAYRFDLLWPHDPPQHEKLTLYIRLTTPDGRHFDAHQTIYVKLGEQLPNADASNIAEADSPAPEGEPVRSELVSTQSASAGNEMGQFEADDPAPTGDAPASNALGAVAAQHGATWRPNR